MLQESRRPRSLASILLWVILSLILLQAIVLGVAFVGGGVVTKSREYAVRVFAEKVGSRLQFLSGEMLNRWSRIDDTARQLAHLPYVRMPESATEADMEQFWIRAYPELMNMMRSTGVTDVFIILANDGPVPEDRETVHKALYLRKTDPFQPDEEATLLVGPGSVARRNNIYLGAVWVRDLTLTPENRDLFDKPLELARGSTAGPAMLAYWHRPVSLVPEAPAALTYTMPLLDNHGQVRGVLGVGMLESYFNVLLTTREAASGEEMGYVVAQLPQQAKRVQRPPAQRALFSSPKQTSQSSETPQKTSITTSSVGGETILLPRLRIRPGRGEGAVTDHVLRMTPAVPASNLFYLQHEDPQTGFGFAQNEDGTPHKGGVLGCILPLPLYDHQTPFQDEPWVFVGLMHEDNLYAFGNQMRNILVGALLVSLLLGGVLALVISRRVARPIERLVQNIEHSPGTDLLSFNRTGIAEVDRLTTTIEEANRNLTDSTTRMLRVIDIAGVSVGAFEIRHGSLRVQAAEAVRYILLLSPSEAEALYSDETRFMNRLRGLMKHPEPEEEQVYKISEEPERWVRIQLVDEADRLLGVVSDVTAEILKKRHIRRERDYDTLTGLCSRHFFRRQVNGLMEMENGLGIAGMLMLDLDKFKAVNDTYGHQCGDNYMCAMTRAMSVFSTTHSVIGRRSGDEFFIFVFRLESRNELRNMVWRFFDALNDHPFVLPDGTRKVIGISVGLAWYELRHTFETLLHEADTALYKVKRQGGGKLAEAEVRDVIDDVGK